MSSCFPSSLLVLSVFALFPAPHVDEEFLELGHAIDGCHPGVMRLNVPEGVTRLRAKVLEADAQGSKLSEFGQC